MGESGRTKRSLLPESVHVAEDVGLGAWACVTQASTASTEGTHVCMFRTAMCVALWVSTRTVGVHYWATTHRNWSPTRMAWMPIMRILEAQARIADSHV